MEHPHIAKVPEGHDRILRRRVPGRPYFVMELVKGIAITQYCDENRLTPCQEWNFYPGVRACSTHTRKG
jgi:hypothetical protein